MKVKEFNEKYKDFLEEGHYGLAFGDEEFVKWLDSKFQEFIKKPGFKYSQIKVKFGMGRFYCEGLSLDEVYEVESMISKSNYNKKESISALQEASRKALKQTLDSIPEIHWEILKYANNHTKEETLQKYPEHSDLINKIIF